MAPGGRPLVGALTGAPLRRGPLRRWQLRRAGLALALLAAAGAGCGGSRHAASPPQASAPTTIRLSSSAFSDGAALPRAVGCDGDGRPPALSWTGVPAGARELVLTVEDPDAPGGTFVHWVVAGLPARTTELRGPLPAGAIEGENSAGRRGWTPPCPPKADQPHHYVFTLYALSRASGLRAGAKPDAVQGALGSGVLARGRLTGTYSRVRSVYPAS